MTNRALTALIIGVLIVVLGGLWYRAWQLERPARGPGQNAREEPEAKRRPQVRVEMTRCRRVYGRTEMEGYVENIGTVDLQYVTVQSIWKDSVGRIIGTDVIYVVTEESLKPGERRAFHDVTPMSNAARCNARPLDWWS